MSGWFIESVRIYVEEDSGLLTTPRIGKIDVLDSNQTILHHAGRPSYTRTLTFVVFSGYHAAVLPLADGAAKTLTSYDETNEGDYIITSLKGKRLQDISRTTRVFRITMDLVKDGT